MFILETQMLSNFYTTPLALMRRWKERNTVKTGMQKGQSGLGWLFSARGKNACCSLALHLLRVVGNGPHCMIRSQCWVGKCDGPSGPSPFSGYGLAPRRLASTDSRQRAAMLFVSASSRQNLCFVYKRDYEEPALEEYLSFLQSSSGPTLSSTFGIRDDLM